MTRSIRLTALLVLLASALSGCIIDPWYGDGGYDRGYEGGHHHHHRHYDRGPRW